MSTTARFSCGRCGKPLVGKVGKRGPVRIYQERDDKSLRRVWACPECGAQFPRVDAATFGEQLNRTP